MADLVNDTFKWAVGLWGYIAKSEVSPEIKDAIHKTLLSIVPTEVPKYADTLWYRRLGVVSVACTWIDDPDFDELLADAFQNRRHFEALCLLNERLPRLIRTYGDDPDDMSPFEREAGAVHFSEVKGKWLWPHFGPREIACRGTGKLNPEPRLLNCLERLRFLHSFDESPARIAERYDAELANMTLPDAPHGGTALVVTSAYRTPAHNDKIPMSVGIKSQHVRGAAADVWVNLHNPFKLMTAAELAGFTSIGQYAHKQFLHLDIRQPAIGPWVGDGAFKSGVDYTERADTEGVIEPVRDKSLGGAGGAILTAVGSSAAAVATSPGGSPEVASEAVASAGPEVMETSLYAMEKLGQFFTILGEKYILIGAAGVAIYTGFQHRLILLAQVKGLIRRIFSFSGR